MYPLMGFVVKLRPPGGGMDMADENGPWGAPKRATEPSGARFYVWAALIALGAFGVWQLWKMFPGALSDRQDQGRFVNLAMFAILIGSGIVYSRRVSASEVLRNVALWVGVTAVLVIAYTLYHGSGMEAEFSPSYPTEVSASTIAFGENDRGEFEVHGTVNGTTVAFMVDTGATDIVLSPADAQRAGIDLSSLTFNRRYETANGEGRGAYARVRELKVGPIELDDVAVSVNETGMRSSLLGMAFLKKMKSFEIRGKKLYLRWR